MPHVFREEILADRFEWAVIGFRKDAPIDLIKDKQAGFTESLHEWRQMHPHLTAWEALQSWTAANLEPADPDDHTASPWVGPNLASAAFPGLWVRSPIQAANEIDKTVGFPILSPRYRAAYRRLGIDEKIDDPEHRAAITRRVVMATIQPISTYMNAIRERLSTIQRAGGRSARVGGSYINGAAYNPRVLIAMMNIWRAHYNFFDWRSHKLPFEAETENAEGAEVEGSLEATENEQQPMRRIPIPGTDEKILVPKRRDNRIIRTTPAIRMGVHMPTQATKAAKQPEHEQYAEDTGEAEGKMRDRRRDDRPYLPDLSRILYQPWLFHGTPMWAKLQGR